MLCIAFDNETHRFDDLCMTPPAVCMSYCEIVEVAPSHFEVGRAGLLGYHRGKGQALDVLHAWLTMAASGDALLVGAHTAYDVFTSIVSGYERSPAFGEELFGLWIKAYDANAVADVLVRQKLLDLAAGCYKYEVRGNTSIYHRYNLASVAKRHLDITMQKGDDSPRTAYGALVDVPVEQYSAEQRDYAVGDSVSTAGSWILQEVGNKYGRFDKRILENFPGHDPLRDEFNQARAALVLSDISNYGLRTEPRGIDEFERETRRAYDGVREELVDAGLLRREYSKDTKGIAAYIEAANLTNQFGRTPKGSISIKAIDLVATGDPLLERLADWTDIAASLDSDSAQVRSEAEFAAAPLVRAGLVRVDESRDTKAAAARLWAAYADPEAVGLDDASPRPVPRTDSWDPKNNPEHTPESIACVKLDADSCDQSEDPLMQTYAEFVSLGKALNVDLEVLKLGLQVPIHTRYETILETGRTSTSKPNVQNPRRLPGVRECFVPRPGRVFIDTDYPSLELWTLAQTNKWVIGYSTMLDALRAGDDPHLKMACTILGITYAEAKKRKKEPAVANARTAGKGCNFGAPGGLGAAKFAVYAYKSYRIRLGKTPEEAKVAAKVLINQYKATWVEMPEYFRWINSLIAPTAKQYRNKKGEIVTEQRYNVVQPWSGRLRAGATYCAACNSPFQGLGADVAKRAMWLVFKACYGFGELGKTDPMYLAMCRIVNFVHDQLITEAIKKLAHAAALRQAELMKQAAVEVMPDSKMKLESTLCMQWSKKAVSWFALKSGGHVDYPYDKDGNVLPTVEADALGNPVLTPWDLHEAGIEAAQIWLAMKPEKRLALMQTIDKEFTCDGLLLATPETTSVYLKKSEWPSYVVEDSVRAVYPAA